MNIIVNGIERLVGGITGKLVMDMGDKPGTDHLSYGSIVMMAGYKPDRILSVTYTTRRKGDEHREGTLTPGGSVLIEDGMVFNVADTSNA